MREGAAFVVEMTRALAWPIVACVIAVRFWPMVGNLLRNRAVQTVKAFGTELVLEDASSNQKDAPENPSATAAKAIVPDNSALPTNRPALDELVQQVRTQFDRLPETERVPAMIGTIARSRLFWTHEFIYNRIFGSQIAGLRRLDELGKVTIEQAREFFTPYAHKYPEQYRDYGFEGWLNFMVSNGLVSKEGDKLRATVFGHDFLVYLREMRLTEDKPL